jgi:hypothetical protein
MVPEPTDPLIVRPQPMRVEQPPLPDAAPVPAALSPEEMQALEAVFKSKPEDPSDVPAVMGLWSGGLLLHDILKDAATPEEEEEEPALAEPPPLPDDDSNLQQ